MILHDVPLPNGNTWFVLSDGNDAPAICIRIDQLAGMTPREIGRSVLDLISDAKQCRVDELAKLTEPKPTRQVTTNQACSQKGYVYLLKAGPYYKIGRTQELDQRIKQLATLPPFDVELIHVIPTKNMNKLESELHELYATKRKQGEWFELEPENVEFIVGLGGTHD